MSKQKNNVQEITVELEGRDDLYFDVKRQDYINFINGGAKNPFNAMQNLLANSVRAESQSGLDELLGNPANVPEIAGAIIEDYKPDVAAVVKKRKTSQPT